MRMKILLTGGIVVATLALALSGCSAGSNDNGTSDNASASAATAPATAAQLAGTFSGLNGKKVAGAVTISGGTLTLSSFSSDQGPDLHLYLANGTTEADVAAGVEIGTVAYDTSGQTFTLDSSVDTSQYTDLVVHCDKAKVSFGAAELTQ